MSVQLHCTDGKKCIIMLILISLFYFKIPYKVARETDVQSLQFKIINRYIPCKENIYGAKNHLINVTFAMR